MSTPICGQITEAAIGGPVALLILGVPITGEVRVAFYGDARPSGLTRTIMGAVNDVKGAIR